MKMRAYMDETWSEVVSTGSRRGAQRLAGPRRRSVATEAKYIRHRRDDDRHVQRLIDREEEDWTRLENDQEEVLHAKGRRQNTHQKMQNKIRASRVREACANCLENVARLATPAGDTHYNKPRFTASSCKRPAARQGQAVTGARKATARRAASNTARKRRTTAKAKKRTSATNQGPPTENHKHQEEQNGALS